MSPFPRQLALLIPTRRCDGPRAAEKILKHIYFMYTKPSVFKKAQGLEGFGHEGLEAIASRVVRAAPWIDPPFHPDVTMERNLFLCRTCK